MRLFVKTLLSLLSIVAVVIVAFFVFVLIKSSGTTPPIEGENAISEINTFELNGEDQTVILRGANQSNPMVLFLHGGPGSPEYPAFYEHNRALEADLTFAHWEQRGSGLSYHDELDVSSITVDQLVDDGIVLSEILKERFGKDKIYLLGHSWGSMLGMLMLQKKPDLFHAFFSVGQVSNQRLGERVSYDWVVSQARAEDNQDALAELSELDPMMAVDDPGYIDYIMTERKWVEYYGGSFKEGGIMKQFVWWIITMPEYDLSTKINYMPANLQVLRQLWPEVISNNLMETVPSVEVPLYIFQGRYDYQTPYALAKQYFDSIEAPKKDFFTFENSAHGVMYEEPEKFNRLILGLVDLDH